MPIDLACFKGNVARIETGTHLQEYGIVTTKLIYLTLQGLQLLHFSFKEYQV